MAAAVRSTGEPTPVSIKSVLLNSSQGVRTNFRFRVILNDGSTSVDMADVGWDQYVRRILIEETIRGPDRLILTMQNPIGDDAETHLFSDATLLSEGSTAQVSIGWEETDLVDHGTFYLSRPRQTYSGSDSIKVIGYSGEVLLSREGAKRRFYEKKTDSQLAHEIAAKYGLKTDIEGTSVRYDRVIQLESDYHFLKRRATLCGYLFYVHDRTLHFHYPKRVPSAGLLLYREEPDHLDNNVRTLNLEVTTHRAAPTMEKNGVNLETWDVLTGSGRGGDDYLAEGANRSGAISRSYDVVSGSVKSRSSVDLVGEDTQVKEFIVGEGQLIDSEEVQRQAEDFAMRAAWGVVSAKGTSVGLEFLRPGKTVLFKMGSFKRFPGEYFIRSVEHDYDLKRDIGYVSRWDLVRSFQYSGEFNPSLKSAIAPSASYGRGAPGSIDSDLLGVSPQSASVGLQPTGDVASVFSTGGQ